MARIAMVLLLVCAAGCEDIDSPAELDHAQVLAVSASPAQVPHGEQAILDVLVAGPDGDIEPVSVSWVARPSVGSVSFIDGVAFYRAPDSGGAIDVDLQVDIELPSGGRLVAEKRIFVGADSIGSPVIRSVRANGAEMTTSMELSSSTTVELSLDVDSTASEAALTTWHATCGTFERYRQPIAAFETPDEACRGVLYAVYRDGAGGVAWIRVPLDVN